MVLVSSHLYIQYGTVHSATFATVCLTTSIKKSYSSVFCTRLFLRCAYGLFLLSIDPPPRLAAINQKCVLLVH
jgi:hypothetical protein